MKEYYCRATTKNGSMVWGYRKARTADLALDCFLQDKSLSHEDVKGSFADEVDYIQLSRLMKYIPAELDPWGCEPAFNLSLLSDIREEEILSANTSFDSLGKSIPDSRWHAARILWMTRNPESLLDPISIDNDCAFGRCNPIPMVLDGWHRLFAHRFLGKELIPALYGGRVDLRNYLTGKRKTAPTE